MRNALSSIAAARDVVSTEGFTVYSRSDITGEIEYGGKDMASVEASTPA
ncbi:MAG: hypothetical protein QW057_09225 [Candidatus Bathyarchaeia archaeon]